MAKVTPIPEIACPRAVQLDNDTAALYLVRRATQIGHAGTNFGWRWAYDVIGWERRFGHQPSNQRRSMQAVLAARLQAAPAGASAHAFYDAAYSASCLDAP